MKIFLFSVLVLSMSMFGLPVFSQTATQAENDTALLGLPGDNLDLYAVLNIFQKSKTIEDFEKTLNLKETAINNLDLDLNDTVDFIKVVTKQDGDNFTFVLQVDVSKTEIQDVAVILLTKDKDGKITLQIVGDKALYGDNYIIEPKPPTPSVTPNPAYTGSDPVPASAPATNTVVVVESAPVVQYVYSPVYVPYYPPYYYHYYPPYYAAFTVMAVGVYHHNNYYHHYGYHGGYHGGNTVVIHNENHYNNYNNNRRTSNTVNHNNASGNYNRNNVSTRPASGTSASARPSATPSTSQARAGSSAARPSTSQAAARPSTSQSGSSSRSSAGYSSSSRPSSSNMSTSSASRSNSSRSSYGGSRGGGGGGRRR
jgi:uncharacterized membrane protein YgcG